MSKLLVVHVVLAALLQNCVQSTNDNLKSVVVLYRHGDRAPVANYANDPYDESYWPLGYGQLSNIGKNQHYALGQFLRNRYSDFLPDKYNVSEFRIIASNVDRCLMSAASNLAGLYPPVDDQIWNSELLWQPFPIHTTPEVQDAYLAQGTPCAKYDALYAGLTDVEEVKDLLQSNEGLLSYLTEHSGQSIETLSDVMLLYNTLYIEDLYNLTLPRWARPVFYGNKNFTHFYDFWFSAYTYTREMQRLRAGPLVDLITSYFENVAYGIGSPSKFLMLSAHDSTVASLLNSLEIFDKIAPVYAATVILELREGKESNYVNIYYKKFNTVTGLTLPNCTFDCDLNDFRAIVEPVRLSAADQAAECQN